MCKAPQRNLGAIFFATGANSEVAPGIIWATILLWLPAAAGILVARFYADGVEPRDRNAQTQR